MSIFGYVIATLIFVMAPIAVSAVYSAEETIVPVTKDNEVMTLNDVKVKKVVTTQTDQETVYTLSQIDAQISAILERILHLQGDIVVLQLLRAKIETEAKKVILKKEEAPKPIEEVK